MSKLIKFTVLLFALTFAHSIVFGWSGYCEVCDKDGSCKPCPKNGESVKIDTIRMEKAASSPCTGKIASYDTIIGKRPVTYKICEYGNGHYSLDTIISTYIQFIKSVETDSTFEYTYMISDTLGNIEMSRYTLMKDYDIMLLIYDGVTLDIIHSPNPCVFKVIESARDTVSFRLDPKKEFIDFINNISVLTTSATKLKNKQFIDTSSVYFDLIKSKYYDCKRHHGEAGK